MISKEELLKWVESLPADSGVAIDEGGLQLHALDADSVQPTEAYIEVGGYPEDDLPDDVAAIAPPRFEMGMDPADHYWLNGAKWSLKKFHKLMKETDGVMVQFTLPAYMIKTAEVIKQEQVFSEVLKLKPDNVGMILVPFDNREFMQMMVDYGVVNQIARLFFRKGEFFLKAQGAMSVESLKGVIRVLRDGHDKSHLT